MSLRTESFAGTGAEWDAFVSKWPHATQSHLFGWKQVIERVFGHRSHYLAARNGEGQVVGVLPMFRLRSIVFGDHLVSMPFLNSGGPLGNDEATCALAKHAVRLRDEMGSPTLEFRCRTPLDIDLPPWHGKITAVLKIPDGGAEQLWREFPGKLRSQIRRPEKEGVTVRFGTDQIVPFFEVFARNMRDLGTPTHPLLLFREIAAAFGKGSLFGVAYLGSEPIAAACALRWRHEMEMTWASSLRAHNRIAPNMLLYWAFIQRAAEDGVHQFDFGRCTPGAGTHRFKQQWGGTDLPLWWYRQGTPVVQHEGAFGLASSVWRRIPVPIANVIGSRIRGAIPA